MLDSEASLGEGSKLPQQAQQPVRVTFDTNTLSGVVDPNRREGQADQVAYQTIHDAVQAGRIRGFFSEALVTLDAIGRKCKAEILGGR